METKNPAFPPGQDPLSRPWSASALWPPGSTPSSRLSTSRDSLSSTTTSSNSSWTTKSESPGPVSCVTRHTSRDECALYRFIVWAAVQRNACRRLSPTERLQCPLLQCRQRFPDHESMLRHLSTCDMLSTGEYWCYDCEKVEKFTDRKCKRCLGHPGKRRKIIKMAKTLFSNLGLKMRKDEIPSLNQDDRTPFINIYDDLNTQPEQVELSCNEIVEIDSLEIPQPRSLSDLRASLCTVPQSGHQGSENHYLPRQTAPEVSLGAVAGSSQTQPLDPYAGVAGLHCASGMLDSLEPTDDWRATGAGGNAGGANGPIDIAVEPPDHVTSAEVPVPLQLNTDGSYLMRPTALRGQKLSPQSSVRSNASASTAFSNHVSPGSVFSSGWSVNSGFETGDTSPISDWASDRGFLSRGGSNASRQSRFVCGTISELPADLPAAYPDDLLMSTQPGPSTIPPTKCSDAAPPSGGPSRTSADPESLAKSAWEALQTHVSSSLKKIQQLPLNPLARELQSVGAQAITKAGLATLKGILHGQFPATPHDILCFVHVTYAFSLVVHEDDIRGRAKRLFVQAFLYSDRLPIELRNPYLEVAAALWYPSDLSPTELDNMLSRRRGITTPQAGTRKRKEHAASSANPPTEMDEFVEIARFFLDELEHAALSCNASGSIVIQTSDLWTEHLLDIGIKADAQISPDFSINVGFVVSMLRELFPEPNGLAGKLKRVQNRVDDGDIQNVRRVELELIQAGKGFMAGEKYFDRYVPELRQHCERLYAQPLPSSRHRLIYHLHGVKLLEDLISSRCGKKVGRLGRKTGDEKDEESLNDILASVTADSNDGSFEPFLALGPSILNEGVESTIDPSTLLDPDALSKSPGTVVCGEGKSELMSDSYGLCRETGTGLPRDAAPSPQPRKGTASSAESVESELYCEICGFRPSGEPRWFRGTLAKHKKLQHSTTPPVIYRCPYPGCTSQYRNRPDNLRQHQRDKSHFVDGEEDRRPSKKRKVEQHRK